MVPCTFTPKSVQHPGLRLVWLPILPRYIDVELDICLSSPNSGSEPEPPSWNNGTDGAGEGVNGAAWTLNALLLLLSSCRNGKG